MGNNHPKISSPYYDRYFGPNYNKIVGNTLGEYGQYFLGDDCCSPPLPPPKCAPKPQQLRLDLQIQPQGMRPFGCNPAPPLPPIQQQQMIPPPPPPPPPQMQPILPPPPTQPRIQPLPHLSQSTNNINVLSCPSFGPTQMLANEQPQIINQEPIFQYTKLHANPNAIQMRVGEMKKKRYSNHCDQYISQTPYLNDEVINDPNRISRFDVEYSMSDISRMYGTAADMLANTTAAFQQQHVYHKHYSSNRSRSRRSSSRSGRSSSIFFPYENESMQQSSQDLSRVSYSSIAPKNLLLANSAARKSSYNIGGLY